MMRRRIIGVGALVLLLVVAGCSPAGTNRPPSSEGGQPGAKPGETTAKDLASGGVRAQWVVDENRRPGTPSWRIPKPAPPGLVEGFADQTYVQRGQPVRLFVNTTAHQFHVEAYRLGYYQGTGGRLVWQSQPVPGVAQPPCPKAGGTNMVSCDNWRPSLTVPITKDFVEGDYLFKLVGDHNEQSYVPLTVWNPASHAAYAVKNDVFTWQAWNTYGGSDYYVGDSSCSGGYPLCSRARVVSYDRPYGDRQGAGDFLDLEAPLVRNLEQHGLDVSYVNDLAVQQHPEVAANHRALLSLGHDECWSLKERQAAQNASATHGVNMAFFGASGMLRHVRTQPSPIGPDRQLVDYRNSEEDPLNGKGDPGEVTGNTWSNPPANWPESPFVGEDYVGFLHPNTPHEPLVVSDEKSWIYQGTGLHNGDSIPAVVSSDADGVTTQTDHPPGLQIMGHSPLPVKNAETHGFSDGPTFYSDMTYYTDPRSGAGVWDSGTNNWIPALDPCEPGTQSCPAAVLDRITTNMLGVLGQGPAHHVQPSQPNWQQVPPQKATGGSS